MEKTMQLAMENKDYIVEMRRHFHSHPEASEHEVNTSKRIFEELEKMGLEPKMVCSSGTGVMCDIKGKGPGKTIALRADMDALSVQELNDVPYKSTVDGMMHACGHDAHTATLLGAAKILTACRDDFNGTVRLLFQPAEETGYGAKAMIEDGCLDGVDATMGTHVNPSIKAGTFSVEAGPRLAAATWFKYRFIGKPGHGAQPHQGVDAGLAACAAALDLQHVVSREFPADQPLVITIGKIEAGTRFNVIAAEATLEGTVRCYDPDIFRAVPASMERVVKSVADAVLENGGRAVGVFPAEFPRTLLHPGLNESVIAADLAERKRLMLDRADVCVALPGSFGTWDELFDALALRKIRAGHVKPVGVLNIDGYFDALLAFIRHSVETGFTSARHAGLLKAAPTPELLFRRLAGSLVLSGENNGTEEECGNRTVPNVNQKPE